MNELHEDAAAYALDALDAPELERFEEHLAGCADCRREVAGLQEVASALSLGEPVPVPPLALRASVLDAVAGVPQLSAAGAAPGVTAAPEVAKVTGAPVARRALVTDEAPDPEAEPAPEPAADPVVDELALRRANRRTRVLSLLVAAVTVVALALGFTVWGLARPGEPPVAGSAPTVTVPQVDPALLAAPDARIYTTKVNGAAVSFVVSKSQDRAVFVSADLPAAPAGDVYHLWTLQGSAVRPDNVFSASGQTAQELSGPIDTSTNLAINVEPAGTTPQAPTTPVLGRVNL